MRKYDQFESYLRNQPWDEVRITFAEIEHIMRAKLPESAKQYRAWWSNNPSNSGLTRAWLNAGYLSEQVDLPGEKLVLRRIHQLEREQKGRGMAEATAQFASPAAKSVKTHPLLGALKGMVVIENGSGLNHPAMPEWAELVDAKYGIEPQK